MRHGGDGADTGEHDHQTSEREHQQDTDTTHLHAHTHTRAGSLVAHEIARAPTRKHLPSGARAEPRARTLHGTACVKTNAIVRTRLELAYNVEHAVVGRALQSLCV